MVPRFPVLPSDPVESFRAIAADQDKRRAFLGSIGDARAPSRLRIAELVDGCETVLDVGCGPATLFRTLEDRRSARNEPLSYSGWEPCKEMLELAMHDPEWGRPRRYETATLLWHCPDVITRLHELAGMHALGDERPGQAIVLRHVLEHQADPWPLLEAAAAAAGRVLVVVLSQATRLVGTPGVSLATDHHLGATRWCHWRPHLLQKCAALLLDTYENGVADGLVIREELFAWRRPATLRG